MRTCTVKNTGKASRGHHVSKKIDVDKSEIKSYTSAACTCLGCISQEIKERIHVHGRRRWKWGWFIHAWSAWWLEYYMLARLQLSSIYYYPNRCRKQPSYQNEVFGPMTPTEANRPEHKAGGLLDRKDDRAPVDMSKPPCSRWQHGLVEYKTRVLLTTYLLPKPPLPKMESAMRIALHVSQKEGANTLQCHACIYMLTYMEEASKCVFVHAWYMLLKIRDVD